MYARLNVQTASCSLSPLPDMASVVGLAVCSGSGACVLGLRVLACVWTGGEECLNDGWGAETKVRQSRVRQKSRWSRCNGDGRAKAKRFNGL